MKINWQIKKLGEVCKVFTDGNWIEKKDQSSEGIRLVQTGNIGNGVFKDREEKARYISEKIFKQLRCTEILPFDCLISRLPDPVGRSCIIPDTKEKMITAVDCTIIRFKKETILAQWFVYYSLSQEYQNQINKHISGATRQRISRSNLGLIDIPLPPLLEQQRIVEILDEVFGGVDKTKENAGKNLQSACELFESYLQNVFANPGEGWESQKLRIICEIKPPKKKAIEKLKSNDLVSFVPMEDLLIRSKNFVTDKEKKLEEVYGSYTYFADEDVLLAKITPCFENGKIGIARNLKNGIGFGSSEYIVFRTNGEIIPEYLFYFLSRDQFRKEGKKSMTGAVGHKRVSKDFIENYKLPFPKSIAEQKAIVAKLDSLSEETKKLENIYKQKLANLKELKKSILIKAFSGEL